MMIYALATFSNVSCTEDLEIESICEDHEMAIVEFNDLLDEHNCGGYTAERINEFTIKQTMSGGEVYFWVIVTTDIEPESWITIQRS